MTALIVVPSVVVYAVMAGISYAGILEYLEDKGTYDLQVPAAMGAAFWPFTLPVLLGIWVARIPERRRDAAVRLEQEIVERDRNIAEMERKYLT